MIILARESTFEFLISGYFAWDVLETTKTYYWGDILSLTLAVYGILLALVFLSITIWIVSNKRKETLENLEFRRKYGALYEDFRTKNRLIGFYHAVY